MNRHFAVAIISVGSLLTPALAQHPTHSAVAATNSSAHPAVSKPAPKPPEIAHKSAQAARFQQVAVSLNLNTNQKNNVGNLIQSARQQLQANRADTSLTATQQQSAAQAIKQDMIHKFIQLLTPEQKAELTRLLMKRKPQSSSEDSSSGAGSSPSAPEIPSVDAPDNSGSNDSQQASSGSDAAKTDAAASASNATADASTAQSAPTKSDSSNPPAGTANSGQLSDAQLAEILNSFIQDDASELAQKPATRQSGGGPTS